MPETNAWQASVRKSRTSRCCRRKEITTVRIRSTKRPGLADAETTLAPEDAAAQGLLGGIVSRFNALLVDKGPQGSVVFENVTAGGLGLPMLDQERTQLQQALHFAAVKVPIADPMPQGKEPLDLVQQQTTERAECHPGLPKPGNRDANATSRVGVAGQGEHCKHWPGRNRRCRHSPHQAGW